MEEREGIPFWAVAVYDSFHEKYKDRWPNKGSGGEEEGRVEMSTVEGGGEGDKKWAPIQPSPTQPKRAHSLLHSGDKDLSSSFLKRALFFSTHFLLVFRHGCSYFLQLLKAAVTPMPHSMKFKIKYPQTLLKEFFRLLMLVACSIVS